MERHASKLVKNKGYLRRRSVLREQTQLGGPGGRLPAVCDVELLIDALEVGIDGLGRDEELGGDLLVLQALRQELEDFVLAIRQHIELPSSGAD